MARAIRARVLSLLDFLIPKALDIWVFPVYFLGKGSFCDNSLAVLRSIDRNVRVKCYVLTRDEEVLVDDERCVVVRMSSYRGTWILLRSGVVFAQHSLWLDYAKAKFIIRNLQSRVVVNLWHGIPIKNLSHRNTGIHMSEGLKEMPHYVIPCSSELDQHSMMLAFHVTPKENFWITGIPRNDFLRCDESRLPGTYKTQLSELKSKLRGRRLILYAPTYRETPTGGEYFEFTPRHLEKLGQLLRRHNAVLGVRFHSYRQPSNQEGLLAMDESLDLSGTVVDDVRLLVRESSAVITDYSSISLDALYARAPLVCFVYDLEHYETRQRGFFYDLRDILGENIAREFDELEHRLDRILTSEPVFDSKDSADRSLFESQIFLHRDDRNGERFASRLLDHVQARFGKLLS